MPLANRLLDVFFRTLDVVDSARERVDRALGRSLAPEPWTTDWSPVPEAPRAPGVATVAPAPTSAPARAPAPATRPVKEKEKAKPATKGKAKAKPKAEAGEPPD